MKLHEFLETEKLTLAAFGESVGVPNRQTMSRYARGERFPPADVLIRIQRVTGGKVTAIDFAEQHASEVPA